LKGHLKIVIITHAGIHKEHLLFIIQSFMQWLVHSFAFPGKSQLNSLLHSIPITSSEMKWLQLVLGKMCWNIGPDPLPHLTYLHVLHCWMAYVGKCHLFCFTYTKAASGFFFCRWCRWWSTKVFLCFVFPTCSLLLVHEGPICTPLWSEVLGAGVELRKSLFNCYYMMTLTYAF
jgi:hypothetical protein